MEEEKKTMKNKPCSLESKELSRCQHQHILVSQLKTL